MAPLPIIPNTYRCTLKWKNTDDASLAAVNVMHIVKSGTNPAAVATALDTHVAAGMWAHTSTHSSIYEVDITPLDGTSTTFPFSTGSPAKWTGSTTTGEVIPQVACIIKMLTAKRGRSFRGRVYLPWVIEAALTYGNISPSNVTTLTAAWVTWLGDMTSAGFIPSIASYKLASSEPIIATTCESFSGTVRRRQLRTSN